MWSEQVAAQDKSVEEQLDERFADVVAARAAANGVAAETAEEAAAEATTEVAAEAARTAESEAATTMVEPAAAADEPSPADEHDCTTAVELDVE